jgi:phosphoglycolate phosphatase-like HAD superfamily hydrolase
MPRAVILFDVDGTLLITSGATSRAIRSAIAAVLGQPAPSGTITAGRLDQEIFCDLASHCGIADPMRCLEPYKRAYLRELRRELTAHANDVRLLPGVPQTLARLRLRQDVVVGLLTGNFRQGVEAKFAAAGLDMALFPIGAFAEDGACRSDLVHAAIAQASAYTAEPCLPAHVVLVGDTPRDIECARQASCRVLAAATGRYTLDELQAHHPDAAVKDLTDTEQLDRLIAIATDH